MKKQSEQITVTIEAPSGINSQTTKLEEIDIMTAITYRVRGTQTYLDSLFTDDLLDYFTGRVKDDFSPDIYQDYMNTLEKNHKMSADLAKMEMTVDLLRQDNERITNVTIAQLMEKDNMIDRLTETISLERKRYAEQGTDKFNAIQERDNLIGEIVKLKVKLFDLMTEKS